MAWGTLVGLSAPAWASPAARIESYEAGVMLPPVLRVSLAGLAPAARAAARAALAGLGRVAAAAPEPHFMPADATGGMYPPQATVLGAGLGPRDRVGAMM
jgi:hypothetical protein